MSHAKPPESPRIDKANFPSRSQTGYRVGVFGFLRPRRTNQQTPGHSQMNNPLGGCGLGFL
jgi:hypothetical protein